MSERPRLRGVLSVLIGAALHLSVAPRTGAAADSDPSLERMPTTPAEYERLALQRDPQVKSIDERRRAALEEADAAAANWPQPRIEYRGFVDGMWLDEASSTHLGTVSQTFPWPGLLDEAADPAVRRAEALRHRLGARALEVVFEVRSALVAVAQIDAKRELFREKRELYAQARDLVESEMESDRADYGDLLRLETAREKIADRLDVLEARRGRRLADLRNLLRVESDAELSFDFDGPRDPLDVESDVPPRGDLARMARRSHPALAADRAESLARAERAEYARKQRLPSPTVSLGIRSKPDHMGITGYDRRTAFVLGLSVPIPVFGAQYDHAGRRQERLGEASDADRRGELASLLEGIESAVVRIDEKRERIERYRDELVPLAADATEQTLGDIETGDRSVTDFILSFEQQIDLETNLVDFRAAVALERARLEKLTGGAFEARPEREGPTSTIDDLSEAGEDDE